MGFAFSSMARRTTFYVVSCFLIPFCALMGYSYYYWDSKHGGTQWLIQRNAAHFYLQELDNSIFYSRIAELSNLSLIRSELYRLYRIVDMTAQNQNSNSFEINYNDERTRVIAPSPSPNAAVSIDTDESYKQKSFSFNTDLFGNNVRATPISPNHQNIISDLDLSGGLAQSEYMLELDSTIELLDPEEKESFLESLNSAREHFHQRALDNFGDQHDHAVNESQASQNQENNAEENTQNQANEASINDFVNGSSVNLSHEIEASDIDAAAHHDFTNDAASDFDGHNEVPSAFNTLTNPNKDPLQAAAEAKAIAQEQALQARKEVQAKEEAAIKRQALAHTKANPNASSANKNASDTALSIVLPGENGHIKSANTKANETAPEYEVQLEVAEPTVNEIYQPVISPRIIAHATKGSDHGSNYSSDTINLLSQHLLDYAFNLSYSDFNHALERRRVIRSMHQLQSLGYQAFTINPKKPSEDIFISESYRGLLSSLKNDNRSLIDILLHNYSLDGSYFVILQGENNDDDDPKASVLANFSGVTTAEGDAHSKYQEAFNSVKAKANANAHLYDNSHEELLAPLSKGELAHHGAADIPNRAQDNTFMSLNNGASNNLGFKSNSSYLALIAPLSYDHEQLLVIISDISKLQQQEEVLKRLIASAINDLILTSTTSTKTSIALLDQNFNTLAGNMSKEEVKNSITPQMLEASRINGLNQSYDRKNQQYVSVGYFRPYKWYVAIVGYDVGSETNLLYYICAIGIAGVSFILFGLFLLTRQANKDVTDLTIINNKLKHMATLIQDPLLLQRVCEGLPRRKDEYGELSSRIRLMAKTVYQSIHEVLNINSSKIIADGERNIVAQLRQSALNREILLREYYKNCLNVHTELSADTSGDFYDVIALSPKKLAFFIGAMDERGLMATNVALLNICLFRQMLRLTESIKMPLSKVVTEVNKNISENNPKDVLASICIIIVDQETGHVDYLNAGHNLPIIYHRDQDYEYLDIRNGPVLGISPDQKFNSVSFELKEGDCLLFYTDGVLDCPNSRGEPLGQEGFELMLQDESFTSAVDTINNLTSKLKQFSKDSTLDKDYTIACYQYRSSKLQNLADKFSFSNEEDENGEGNLDGASDDASASSKVEAQEKAPS